MAGPPLPPGIVVSQALRRPQVGRTCPKPHVPPANLTPGPSRPAVVISQCLRRPYVGRTVPKPHTAAPLVGVPVVLPPQPPAIVVSQALRRPQVGRTVPKPHLVPVRLTPTPIDVVVQVGQTVGGWFAGVTAGRWAAGSTVSRWQAGETVSAWKVISQGATMSQTIASASLQYVRAPVAATVNGAAFNPTVDTVQMAFTSTFREPVLADFNAGSWETAGSTYYARCLVGPGGAVALAAGVWFVWVKITDSPEIPVLPAGTLTVTP